ncbi:XisH family protein [Fibrella aquatilis]|uniref:XisH family protein n=1 Tax=Fibrella aquatilis TaxID=2817059 RepID=A0A939GCV5_9BACT|nr:XisH family protein [Fibrella aquatilis]MBO0934341.1 XisH family protein [Fibrella aquatilis]
MAKDFFHQAVRTALEKDGWTITHDPYPLRLMGIGGEIDLGAERILAAEKDTASGSVQKIAVEVKSFLSPSFMYDFHVAIGQYTNYRVWLERKEADRTLYLAVPAGVYETHFQVQGIEFVCQSVNVQIVVFNETEHLIESWKS